MNQIHWDKVEVAIIDATSSHVEETEYAMVLV
jgi:hypothetical protein